MSSAAARFGLACCLWATACGETRLIGAACPGWDCALGGRQALDPVVCGAQFASTPVRLAAGDILDRCELFTLDTLAAAGGDGQVYLTGAQALLSPVGQHLDVRLAPAIDGFEDGPVACQELYARAVPWIPLMTTQQGDDRVDLSGAPLVASASHRMLINHQMVNATGGPIEVSVVMQVACADSRPAIVSQAFEFSDRERQHVVPGQRALVSGGCVFEKDVLVSRLYRRTHLISAFSVETLRGAGKGELLWSSGLEWTLDLEPPLAVAGGEGFRWQCAYDNTGDLPFEVGGDSPDACALLGLYRLPGGGEDDSPERCTR
jgi:hypothetical protein